MSLKGSLKQEFQCEALSCIPLAKVAEVQQSSRNFWKNFPSDTARIYVLQRDKNRADIASMLNSVYPIITDKTLELILDFLNYKRIHGHKPERELYKNMSGLEFVDRLLRKRPLSFYGPNDRYVLRESFKGGIGGFDKIGTNGEVPPLLLKDYISYDEMKISALVSLSSKSFFISDGNRKNNGRRGEPGTFEEEGVIVGQVGARMKKQFCMEYQDCVVDPAQNTHTYVIRNGLLKIWEKFWDVKIPVYSEANGGKFLDIGNKLYLNTEVLIKRMEIPASILLNEADARAKSACKKAYIHVVGLGLGVWRLSDVQEELFLEAWAQALTKIRVTNVAVVDFSRINGEKCGQASNGCIFPGTEITVKFSKRNLHDRIPSNHLLVCSYAWNSNAYPANEFWDGKTCSIGDSAAACSSGIVEFHNAELNPRVSSACLRISTEKGLFHIYDYINKHISEESSQSIDSESIGVWNPNQAASVNHVDRKEIVRDRLSDQSSRLEEETTRSSVKEKDFRPESVSVPGMVTEVAVFGSATDLTSATEPEFTSGVAVCEERVQDLASNNISTKDSEVPVSKKKKKHKRKKPKSPPPRTAEFSSFCDETAGKNSLTSSDGQKAGNTSSPMMDELKQMEERNIKCLAALLLEQTKKLQEKIDLYIKKAKLRRAATRNDTENCKGGRPWPSRIGDSPHDNPLIAYKPEPQPLRQAKLQTPNSEPGNSNKAELERAATQNDTENCKGWGLQTEFVKETEWSWLGIGMKAAAVIYFISALSKTFSLMLNREYNE